MISSISTIDRRYVLQVISILGILATLSMYVETMIMPSLPDLQKDFHVSESEIAWVLTAYMISGVVSTPLIGKLSDLYGRKKILTIIILIYSFGTLLAGIVKNFQLFIILRAIQGIGMSMFPIAFSIITEQFPRDEIPRASGILSAMFSIGSIVGIVGGASVAEYFGWRMTFLTAAPFCFLMAILVHLIIKEYRPRIEKVKLDYLGAFLLGSSLALITYAFERAPHLTWYSVEVISSLTSGIVLFLLFLYWENVVEIPLVDLRKLREINVFTANFVGIITGFIMFMNFQAIIYLLRIPKPVGQELTVLQTGIYMIPVAISSMISALVVANLIRKIGVRKALIIGQFLAIVLTPIYLLVNLSNLFQIILASTIFMIGIVTLLVALINVLIFSIRIEELGIMTGLNMVFRFIGGSLGPAVVGSLQSTFKTVITKVFPVGTQIIAFTFTVPSQFVVQLCSVIAFFVILLSIPFVFKVQEVYLRR